MISSNLIVDSLSESRAESSLKVHVLPSIFRDMGADLQSSGYWYYCEICERRQRRKQHGQKSNSPHNQERVDQY
jgi:hypothetical protein